MLTLNFEPAFTNQSITKIPMKRLLEMIDYSIKNPGEAEYAKQN